MSTSPSSDPSPATLFSVNANFGLPARGRAEFPDPTSLLHHLDRLGVARALTWHISARDTDPTWGNRLLLTQLANCPAAHGRLIPALTAGASTLHEAHAMDELKATLQQHRLRALRLFPVSLHHTLAHVEPLLAALASLQPVILIACDELTQPEELDATAARFPHLSFILTSAAWADLPAAFDLLQRRPNVHLDTSWLHTCGTIETIARLHSPQRLVFGLGPKTNGGASLGELTWADLDPAAREKISHRNLESLLALLPLALPPAPAPAEPRLWHRFLATGHCGLDILDAHGHLGPVGTWMLHRQQIEDQIAAYLPRMDRLGIRTMLVSGTHALFGDPVEGNHLLQRVAGLHPERFQGYLVFNPHYHDELLPHLDSFFAGPFFVGFKLLSSYWGVPVTDPRYRPVWQYAHQHRLPILLHTWDDDFDLPIMLDHVAAEFPGAQFILGHSGGTDPGRASALQLAQRHPNVFLEWCGSYRMTLPYEDLIRTLGPHRFLFGTDATLHSPTWELARFLSLDLPDEMLFPALGSNLRGILAQRR
ncbi:hypothetical protein BH09VER1_BH09VER1_07790 [soil metagenome]